MPASERDVNGTVSLEPEDQTKSPGSAFSKLGNPGGIPSQ